MSSVQCPFCSAPAPVPASHCAHCGSAFEPLLLRGDRIARRYEVLEPLGFGPLGATYRARDLASGVIVAVKTVAPALCPDEKERAALASRHATFAGRTLAGCAMPIAVAVEERFAYVTAPLLDGVTLRAVLEARRAARKPLGAEEALRVLLALVASAAALHSATPHGALYPDNVLVTPRGLVLTGCALASAVPPERLVPRLQAFPRAAAYLAPEVLAGRPITAGADLYAVGCIAMELLAGAPDAAALERAALPAPIDQSLRALSDRDRMKRPAGLGALLDSLSRECGFERRPAPGPLPVPEAPASGSPDTNPGHAYTPPLRASVRPSPQSGASLPARHDVAPPAEETTRRRTTTRTPSPQPVVRAPAPAEPATEPHRTARASMAGHVRGPTPGRLSTDTAVVSRQRAGLAQSGPPGGLSAGRSGPPAVDRPEAPTVPILPIAPAAGGAPAPTRTRKASASKSTGAARESGTPRRDPDGIDPKLLRAARRLDAERKQSSAGEQELDPDEIEALDD